MTTDILDRLRDLLERGVSAPADAVLADAVAEIERLRAERVATVRPLLPVEHMVYTVAKSQIGRGDNPPINTTAGLLMTVERLSGIDRTEATR